MVDDIIKLIACGKARRPHQLKIWFRDNYGQCDDGQAETKDFLYVEVQVWVDIPPKIGVEFLFKFKISRHPESAIWMLSDEPMLIAYHAQLTFSINYSENLRDFSVLTKSDAQALAAARDWLGIKN